MEMVAQAKLLVPDEPSSAAALRTYQASWHVQENPRAGTVRGESTAEPGAHMWRGPYQLLGQEGARRNSKRAGVVHDGRGPVRLGLQSRLLITCLPGSFSSEVPVGLICGLMHFIHDVF